MQYKDSKTDSYFNTLNFTECSSKCNEYLHLKEHNSVFKDLRISFIGAEITQWYSAELRAR
jgi:hypothetical protein